MALYRGVGGAGEANDDATLNAVTEKATDAATSASEAASSASSASTSASNAATSATNAASSASSASTSASTATTQATNAATSATASAASASAANTSAGIASDEANYAEEWATKAEDSLISTAAGGDGSTDYSSLHHAAKSADSASASASSATSAASSAATATTKASEASTSATAAASSASAASTSASNASTSETNAANSASSASTSASQAATSATSAAASAASAAATYDAFDDRYLGAKSSDPTLDNDGNALVAGALYFNTTASEMRTYDGSLWIAASSASIETMDKFKYTATASQTAFTGLDDGGNTMALTVGAEIVTLNGVVLEQGTDYTATSDTITLTTGAAASDELNIYAFGNFTVADTVSKSSGGTFDAVVNFTGGLTTSANVTFGDNDKAIFGAGSDLQIYHDGSNSYIKDAGTGHLQVWANDLRMSNAAGTKSFLYANDGGATVINYDGSQKLATTSTGIDVTGTVTADGLTVDGDANITATNPKFILLESDTTDVNTQIRNGSGSLYIQTLNDAQSSATNRFRIDNSTGDISFYEDTGTTPKFFWDASAECLIVNESSIITGASSTTTPSIQASNGSATTAGFGVVSAFDEIAGQLRIAASSQNAIYLEADPDNQRADSWLGFRVDGSEKMRIDSSGNLLVGKTSTGLGTQGCELRPESAYFTRNGGVPVFINRETSDGNFVEFRKDNATRGNIGSHAGGNSLQITGANNRVYFASSPSPATDNTYDLGGGADRFDDVYATNGTIQTSDRNEKQDIEELSEAEQRVAVACKGLLRKYRWIDAVAKKGDDARIHFGIIAQDLQDAFAAEGLDAGRYAMFISSTWWETQTEVPAVEAVDAVLDDEGNVIEEAVEAKEAYIRTDTYETAEEAPEGATERTRLGVRYPELLAFIIAAI